MIISLSYLFMSIFICKYNYMNTLLSLYCILGLSIIIYGIIQGANSTKFHIHDCNTIYIPEDLSVDTIFKEVLDMDINDLKKRSRELGVSQEVVNNMNNVKKDLQRLVIVNSLSDEHILTENIEDTIAFREHCKNLARQNIVDETCENI
jgi:transcriptional/translational regulatory protein YebC/TACO1